MPPFALSRSFVARLWRTSPPLVAAGALMLPLLAGAALGLWLDPRTIGGAPAWLKPAKFAASIAIYCFSLAWVFTHLQAWPRTRRAVGGITAGALLLEIAIIGVQAWRGAASHFNAATPIDAALYSIMGAAIVGQTLASVAVAIALWRQRLADGALGWALRLGLALTITGAATGGLMTRRTDTQLEAMRSGARLTAVGAHTVGAEDGGPGLPGTGWSTAHGDLRVPHFVGLHGLQVLALVALALPRRWAEHRRVRVMLSAAASYTALFLILLSQAMAGESIASPSPITSALLAGWFVATAAALQAAARHRDRAGAPAGRASATVV